jgi:hypothetical protein
MMTVKQKIVPGEELHFYTLGSGAKTGFINVDKLGQMVHKLCK